MIYATATHPLIAVLLILVDISDSRQTHPTIELKLLYPLAQHVFIYNRQASKTIT
jgi:hypothetical protein